MKTPDPDRSLGGHSGEVAAPEASATTDGVDLLRITESWPRGVQPLFPSISTARTSFVGPAGPVAVSSRGESSHGNFPLQLGAEEAIDYQGRDHQLPILHIRSVVDFVTVVLGELTARGTTRRR